LQYRVLGNTGLQVSALGLGAANLGGVYGEVDEATAIATVHKAFELGVTVFDSSPYYARTRAETVLGKALRTLPRHGYVLMTKCGRYDQDQFDFSPARLRQSVEQSLRHLGTDHVDVLALHDVEFGDLDQILSESGAVLGERAQAGKTRFTGITGLPLAVFRRALADNAALDTVLSYCHATLFDQTLLDLLPDLSAAGLGVINASPTAMGLLSSQGPRSWHPAPADIRATCARAADYCREHGVELAELALQYTCSLPGIATNLCGTAAPTELAANVAASQCPPDPELLAAVQQLLRGIHNRTWPQGRSENQDHSLDS